jgi:type I restriction enzyme S subunit
VTGSSNGVPVAWSKVSLGEVANFEMGQAPPGSASNFTRRGTLFVKAGEFGDKFPIEREWTINPLKFGKKGDVFICVVGATAGKLNLGIDCAIGRSVAAIRPPDGISNSFIYYQLLRQVETLRANSSGSAQGVISRSDLGDIELLVAPVAEQHRVVEKLEELLSDLEAGVSALERARANLTLYRAAVLKAAVEGRLTEKWRAAHPDVEHAEKLLERILAERRKKWEELQLKKFAEKGQAPPKGWKDKYSDPVKPDVAELPRLPEAWCWATVDQVSLSIRYGSSAKTREDDRNGVPVLRMGNIQEGRIDLSRLKFLPEKHEEFPELFLEPRDVLFNRTNSPELVGKTAVYKGNPAPCSYASYLIGIRPLSGWEPDVLAYFVNSSLGRAWIASVVSQQVGQANVNGSKLAALAFPLPPVKEQLEIVKLVEEQISSLDRTGKDTEELLVKAHRLRQSVLKRAFEGKLVPQDPKDEPASELLKRILDGRESRRETSSPKRRKRSSGR